LALLIGALSLGLLGSPSDAEPMEFSNAPIGATVSVLSNDGQAQLATTIINEKNGFFD
jgi:hypothetical protein